MLTEKQTKVLNDMILDAQILVATAPTRKERNEAAIRVRALRDALEALIRS